MCVNKTETGGRAALQFVVGSNWKVRDRKEIERADGKFPPEAIVDIEAEQLQLTAHTPPTSRGAEEGVDCPTETHLKRTGRLVLVMAKCSFYSD